MNIILGESSLSQLDNKYTVLKLDKVTIGSSAPIQAYCVIDIIPLDELPRTEKLKALHISLMEEYYKRNWSFCEDAISHLTGAWNGAMDSFYFDLSTRISTYKHTEPDALWSGIVPK